MSVEMVEIKVLKKDHKTRSDSKYECLNQENLWSGRATSRYEYHETTKPLEQTVSCPHFIYPLIFALSHSPVPLSHPNFLPPPAPFLDMFLTPSCTRKPSPPSPY